MTLRDALHAGIVHLGEWVDAAQSGVDPGDDEQEGEGADPPVVDLIAGLATAAAARVIHGAGLDGPDWLIPSIRDEITDDIGPTLDHLWPPTPPEQVPAPAPGSAAATIEAIAAQIRDLHTSIRSRIQTAVVTDATITALRSLGVDVEPWMTPHLTAAIGRALADHAEAGGAS